MHSKPRTLYEVAYTITIPGKPYAKQRPRFGRGHTYTPHETRAWEGMASMLMRTAYKGSEPLTGPLYVDMCFVWPPIRNSVPWSPKITRPDAYDNCVKIIGDALVKAGVVKDDCLFWKWSGESIYGAAASDAGSTVTIWRRAR